MGRMCVCPWYQFCTRWRKWLSLNRNFSHCCGVEQCTILWLLNQELHSWQFNIFEKDKTSKSSLTFLQRSVRLAVDEGIQTRPAHTSFGFECLAFGPDEDPAIELPGGDHPASPRDLPDNTDGRDRAAAAEYIENAIKRPQDGDCGHMPQPILGSCMCPSIHFWLLGSPHHWYGARNYLGPRK